MGQAGSAGGVFGGRVQAERGSGEGIDEEEAALGVVPIEGVEDGGADEAGVDAAFDEVAGDGEGLAGGPEGDVDAPMGLGVVAVAGGDAAGVGGLEGGVGEEVGMVERVEAVVGVVGTGVDEAVAETGESVLGKLLPGHLSIVNGIDEPDVA